MTWPSDLDLAIRLFAQLVVILATCRVVGFVGKKFGQPQVVGEMIAGVLLGPSLLGYLLPDVSAQLFPKTIAIAGTTVRHPSMQILFVMSQVGLALYMFLVGLEFNTNMIRARRRAALTVSATGILAPFVLGGATGLLLLQRLDCFAGSVTPWKAALFVGSSMCITAFPMLARILYEKGIARTSMGTLALGAAAVNDASAWCLLAIVLAGFKGDASIALVAIGGGVLFLCVMVFVGGRLLQPLELWTQRANGLTPPIFVTAMAVLMLSAWCTDVVGIYSIFGAFICGTVMPRGRFSNELQQRLGFVTTSLFLPLFFVFSGLNTQVGLLDSWSLLGLTLLVIAVAVVGKGVACAMAARLSGEPWRDSIAIGALMNARGLIELILLNIGLSAGVITPTLFTMLVLMAITTTLMASPLFELVYGRHAARVAGVGVAPVETPS